MFPLALHLELWWDGNAMENLTYTWWEKDSSRDTATPEKNTLEVLVLGTLQIPFVLLLPILDELGL